MTAAEDLAARRTAAYDKLREVVDELTKVSDEEAVLHGEDISTNHPAAWVLLVGYDYWDAEESAIGGMVGVYPKDGYQAHWKTAGIINVAKAKVE